MDYVEYVNKLDSLQQLKLAKALCDYSFIMTNRQNPTDESFQKVFYDFYLRSRWAIMTPKNRQAYFEALKEFNNSLQPVTIENVIMRLKNEFGGETYEFSIASKLLHTIDHNAPIYDANVKRFFKCIGHPMTSDSKSSSDRLSLINQDYEFMKKWYQSFITSKEGKNWINWFNSEFPPYSGISDVKKIDFIIWVSQT